MNLFMLLLAITFPLIASAKESPREIMEDIVGSYADFGRCKHSEFSQLNDEMSSSYLRARSFEIRRASNDLDYEFCYSNSDHCQKIYLVAPSDSRNIDYKTTLKKNIFSNTYKLSSSKVWNVPSPRPAGMPAMKEVSLVEFKVENSKLISFKRVYKFSDYKFFDITWKYRGYSLECGQD